MAISAIGAVMPHKCIVPYLATEGEIYALRGVYGSLVHIERPVWGDDQPGDPLVGRLWFNLSVPGPFVVLVPDSSDGGGNDTPMIIEAEPLALHCHKCEQEVVIPVATPGEKTGVYVHRSLLVHPDTPKGDLKMDNKAAHVYTTLSGKGDFDPLTYREVGLRAVNFVSEFFRLVDLGLLSNNSGVEFTSNQLHRMAGGATKMHQLQILRRAFSKLGRTPAEYTIDISWTAIRWMAIHVALAIGWSPGA